MNSETAPAPATEGNDSNEKTAGETTKSNPSLLRNNIVIIAAVALVSSVIIIIIIVVFLVMKDSKNGNNQAVRSDDKFAEIAIAKCEEYAQLACTQEPEELKSNDSGRIVHGEDPSPGIVPYMAYIIVPDDFTECTGTLINEWFVLSAAHCFNRYDPENVVSGYLGFVSKLDAVESPPSFNSTKIYIHDKFDKRKPGFEGDIALLKTLKKVILSASVRPICLNTKLKNIVGDFISAGYGYIEGGEESVQLRMVEMRMDGEVQKKCNKEYNYKDFTRKMICAAHPTEKKGGSLGDSGGPLLYPLKHMCSNVHEQIGVLSIGKNFNVHDPPVTLLYTKVEYYIEWIVKIVWLDPDEPE